MVRHATAVRYILLSGLLLPAVARAQEPAGRPSSGEVTCESTAGGRQACEADTSAGVVLREQTGTSSCLLGRNWGYDDGGIWVSDGCGGVFATAGTQPDESSDDDGFLRKFQPYGRFLAQLAYFDDEFEIQDNASWLGLKFATGDNIKFIAHAELGVNIVGTADRFRAGTRTDAGLLTLEEIEDPPVFGNRLGYLGVDFGSAGRVAIGKDWGVHYDIASYTTDRWNAFGGQASLAYPGSGDGGISGTGRANQVLNYRVTLAEIVQIGAQTQFNNSVNRDAFDGFGGSLQVRVLPWLKIGGAYTKIALEGFVEEEVLGVDGDGEYGIVGLNFTSEILDVGAVWATQKNGDLRGLLVEDVPGDVARVPVVFDGDGIEIYARGKVGDFGINGGFIYYDPETDGTLLDPNFRDRYFILGADWRFADGSWAYTEFRIDNDSVGPQGEPGTDVFVLGFKYQFSWNARHDP